MWSHAGEIDWWVNERRPGPEWLDASGADRKQRWIRPPIFDGSTAPVTLMITSSHAWPSWRNLRWHSDRRCDG